MSSTFNPKAWQDGGLTEFSQTCFADYWEDLPSIKKISLSCEPYNWKHRMALGKYIIENTGSKVVLREGKDVDIWGSNYHGHYYWGYLAQLDWMRRSGRLASPVANVTTKRTIENCDIALDSWWGYMNLNFTVAFYCGAIKAGLAPDIMFLECGVDLGNDPGFRACVDIWHHFWVTHHKKFVGKIALGNEKNRSKAIIQFYRDLWSTHTGIIEASLPRAKKLEQFMPEEDRIFGLGWCHMVELLAAMSWTLLSLGSLMEIGVGYLPSRVLNKDSMKWLSENCPEEYKAALLMMELYRASPDQLSMMCFFFQRLSRWEKERLNLPHTMKLLNSIPKPGGVSIVETLLKTIVAGRLCVKVILPQSISEFIMWNLSVIGLTMLSYSAMARYYTLYLLGAVIVLIIAKKYISFIANL